MGRRTTIKDIAEAAGVSIGTVHCALNGKPGVSEEKRLLINDIARQMNYRPNTLAASLKRKTIRIAAVLPGKTLTSRYYFSFIWQGIRDYIHSADDYNIELLEFPYFQNVNSHSQTLNEILENHQIDGLLTTGYTDPKAIGVISRFGEKGIPVVLISNDVPQTGRLCCVQPNYFQIGQTLAELISRQIPKDGAIALCAGDPIVPSHSRIVQGFLEYMARRNVKNPLYLLQASEEDNGFYETLLRELEERGDIAACCSVNATNSVLLARALVQTGRAGHVTAVGSDLFRETIDYLKQEVLTNLVCKRPYDQGYTAAKCLMDHLLRDEAVTKDVIYIGSEIVFQSSVSNYEDEQYRVLESP